MQHSTNLLELNYGQLLLLPQWKKRRRQILLRDCNKCRACGASSILHVHHRQYHVLKSIGKFQLPWKYSDKYLITLCDNCHKNGHLKYQIPIFTI